MYGVDINAQFAKARLISDSNLNMSVTEKIELVRAGGKVTNKVGSIVGSNNLNRSILSNKFSSRIIKRNPDK